MRSERFDRRWYRFAQEILPCAGEYPRALDLGCGRGEYARLLGREGFSVVCLDANPQNVAACWELGLKTRLADLNQPLPFEDDNFDLVVMLDVIEHIPLADALLLEIKRVLRRSGLLLLSTPNVAWVLHRMLSLMGRPPPGEGYHYRFFSVTNLTLLLDRAGFEIVRRNSWTYPFPGLNRLRKLFGSPRVDWHVPPIAESLWAYSLVWLAENTKCVMHRPRQVWEKSLDV